MRQLQNTSVTHTATARARWMTADAWTTIQHRQHMIKQHIPLIAPGRSSHPFMLKLLRIWRSMVPVFRADREVVKACKEARRAHREALTNDLDLALKYGETRLGTRETSSKQDYAIGQATAHPSYSRDRASRDGCPYEEGLWRGQDDEYKQHSGSRPTAPMSLHGGNCCYDFSSSKTSPSTCKIRAVPNWATPNEIHAMCLDGAEEAVEEFWRSGTPLPPRMAWCAILESRMQKERRAPQLLSDSEVFTTPKKRWRGPRLSQVHQLAGWCRQDDLWRVAGAHSGPLPSLAVRFCAQRTAWAFAGQSGSVLQRQGGA